MLDHHPLADIFPLIAGDDYAQLVRSIAENGLREKIVLFEGRILDGRNRYRAAVSANVIAGDADATGPDGALRPQFRLFDPDAEGDPLRFVIIHNLHRRHLSESQRAMIAAGLADKSNGGDRKSEKYKEKQRENQRTNLSTDLSNAEAAEMMRVSPMSVKTAKQVLRDGAAETVGAIAADRLAVSLAVQLAELPVDKQREILSNAVDGRAVRGAIRAHRERGQATKARARKDREAKLAARQQALPSKTYGIIVADPEWRFEPFSRDTGMDRAADNHYPTSALDVLQRRDVGAIAADDCILFLWATVPMLAEALCCLDSWGFAWFDRRDGHLVPDKGRCRYVSQFAWDKGAAGTGYWTRNRHELLLIATRGKPVAPALGEQLDSVVRSRKGGHSQKPDKVLDWIDRTWPNTARIELNRRGPARKGWDAWGNEAEMP